MDKVGSLVPTATLGLLCLGAALATWIVLEHPAWNPDALARAMRLSRPSVIGRIEKDRFLLDVRTVLDGEETLIAQAARALAPGEEPA